MFFYLSTRVCVVTICLPFSEQQQRLGSPQIGKLLSENFSFTVPTYKHTYTLHTVTHTHTHAASYQFACNQNAKPILQLNRISSAISITLSFCFWVPLLVGFVVCAAFLQSVALRPAILFSHRLVFTLH